MADYPFQLENVHAFICVSTDEAYRLNNSTNVQSGFTMTRVSDETAREVPESFLDFYIPIRSYNEEVGDFMVEQSKLPKYSPIWYNSLRSNFIATTALWIAAIFPEDVQP